MVKNLKGVKKLSEKKSHWLSRELIQKMCNLYSCGQCARQARLKLPCKPAGRYLKESPQFRYSAHVTSFPSSTNASDSNNTVYSRKIEAFVLEISSIMKVFSKTIKWTKGHKNFWEIIFSAKRSKVLSCLARSHIHNVAAVYLTFVRKDKYKIYLSFFEIMYKLKDSLKVREVFDIFWNLHSLVKIPQDITYFSWMWCGFPPVISSKNPGVLV